LPKIMVGLVTASIVVVFTLIMTKTGRDIDAATQSFMLYYAGVFALIGLTASVGAGLMATDRIFMTPGHRVMAQAVHRAFSFGALAFLIIHIVTEILAQRVHVIDAFIPFLSPYRTFYIGLGTIASDLILLLVVTSIVRKRFSAHGTVWRWRAIHYTSYAAFVLGILHGLLAGREARPYVDWSYGFAIAATALALVVRFLAISLRSKGSLSAPAGGDQASGGPRTSPLHAAALSVTQAHLGGTIPVLPAALGSPGTQSWALPPAARDGFAISGPFPAALDPPAARYTAEAAYEARQDPAYMPLGAPAYAYGTAPGGGAYPYPAVDPPRSALTGPGAPAGPVRQPRYEPGYDGPPRFEGAPRNHVPQDDRSSYPYGARSRPADRNTGPIPRASTGPMPRAGNGPDPLSPTGPLPRADTGPMRRPGTGPMPRADMGPMPRAGTGSMPRADMGPMPRAGTGPMPRAGTGPMPRADTGPMPRAGTGPLSRPATGPAAHSGTGPMPRAERGQVSRAGTGPLPRANSEPRLRSGRAPLPDSPPAPSAGPLRGAARRSRRADSADPRNRDLPGPAGGDEWR
jgi:DMSO/TMAO reductase YedYZ heme-binding membrane subunit